MERIKKILKTKQAKRFYRNTANGLIGLIVTYLSGLELVMAPLVIAGLNGISKEIDNYLKQLKSK